MYWRDRFIFDRAIISRWGVGHGFFSLETSIVMAKLKRTM